MKKSGNRITLCNMISLTAIRKYSGRVLPFVTAGSVLSAVPWISCALYIEIFHYTLTIFYLYGKYAGIPLGAAAVIFLSIIIIYSFYSSRRGYAVLLLIFDIHIAVSAAMIIRMACAFPSSVPVWIVIFRILYLPCEICSVWAITKQDGGVSA
ncbi:MAG: hypothetical protein ACRCUT_01885 [Spirochaetota bacterium]